MESVRVLFNQCDIKKHTQILLEFLELKSKEEIPFKRFDIKTKGSVLGFPVDEEHVDLAIFLFYLARKGRNSMYTGAYFIDVSMRMEALYFFGEEICFDAIENPQTVHRALREILTREHASVILKDLDRSRFA